MSFQSDSQSMIRLNVILYPFLAVLFWIGENDFQPIYDLQIYSEQS